MKNENQRSGDYIINTYLPNASPEQREEARESLRRFAKLFIRVHERLAKERAEKLRKLQPPLL